jgi:Phosphotransferase enzyme family
VSTVELLDDPERIDAAWLTEALAGQAGSDARVVDVQRELVGTGQVGCNFRFHLTWEGPEAGLPQTVVGKFPSPDPTSRATAVGSRLYEKEVRFYTEIAPTVDIRTPAVHVALCEPGTGRFVLLLEDLAPARVGDQVQGCGPAEARAALAEAARLHAPRWGDPALEHLEWLAGSGTAAERVQFLQSLYDAVLPGFEARIGSRLDATAVEVVRELGRVLPAWLAARQPPFTVLHGDYRLDNLLFGATDAGEITVAAVDWQTVGLGPGAQDVAYLCGTSLLPDDRRRCELDLVGEYHDRLARAGVEGYSWDECWLSYRLGALAGVLIAVISAQIVAVTPRGDDMFVAMASRAATMALDLDTFSLL